MPMNEFGEIVRSDTQSSSSSTSSGARRNSDTRTSVENTIAFSENVSRQFHASRKKYFNMITLAIATPLYTAIGYFTAEYFQYKAITGGIGALIVGCISFLCTILYNHKWAKEYAGVEYLYSLLFAGFVLLVMGVILAIVVAVVNFVLKIIKGLAGIIALLAILASLAGG